MPENISKKLNITLDTKKAKPINIKDFVPTVGDSIEITISVIEDNALKNLTSINKCRLIGVKPNGKYFEQTENITVEDRLSGILKIKPNLNIFNIEGKTVCTLILEDEDESISIQRFIITVNGSLEGEIFQDSTEDVETLKRLNATLDEYEFKLSSFSENIESVNTNLVALNQSVIGAIFDATEKVDNSILGANEKINASIIEINDRVDLSLKNANTIVDTNLKAMGEKTNNQILQANEKFNSLNVTIDEEFTSLENRLNNADKTISEQILKTIKLKPYELVGSSFMYFSTDVISENAEALLGKSYMLHLSGMLDISTHNSANMIVNFFKQNEKVYVNSVVISDRIVNSRSLSPSIVFDSLVNEIPCEKTGFRLLVRSNITKALNTEDTTNCYLTPLSI